MSSRKHQSNVTLQTETRTVEVPHRSAFAIPAPQGRQTVDRRWQLRSSPLERDKSSSKLTSRARDKSLWSWDGRRPPGRLPWHRQDTQARQGDTGRHINGHAATPDRSRTAAAPDRRAGRRRQLHTRTDTRTYTHLLCIHNVWSRSSTSKHCQQTECTTIPQSPTR